MKGLISGLSAVLIVISCGCAPSQQNEDPEELYQNLVTLNPPEDQSSREDSQVYLDSVDIISSQDRQSLVIHGSFPDGCTSLDSAEHSLHNDTLTVNLSAWRNPDLMCSQVLTQFTFIYNKLKDQEFINLSTVIVNGTTFNI